MPTADFDHTLFEQGNTKGDEQLLVKFFIKPVKNAKKSLDEGRPIFDDIECIDIRVAGSRNGHVCRPARFNDKNRFPKHYAAFKNRSEAPLEGTPLIEWAVVTRSQAEELAFFNVKTVEQLAHMADTQAQKFMGINSLRQKAKDWLKEAKENAPALKLAEELRVRDEQFKELQAKFDRMVETLEELSISKASEIKLPEGGNVELEVKKEPEVKKPPKRRRKNIKR